MKSLTLEDALAAVGTLKAGNGAYVVNIDQKANKLRSNVFFIAGLGVNLAGQNNLLIDQNTKKEIGVTNFDTGNKFNKGRMFLVTGIRILFDVTVGVTPKTAVWKGDAPAVFKNGEISISQAGGLGDLFRHPIGPLAKYAASLSTEQEVVSIAPFLIRDESEIAIAMQLAGQAAADQAYKVELYGYEFSDAAVTA